MLPIPNSEDGALEERSWRGYDPRAAAPLIAVALGSSIALLAGRWYLDDLAATLLPYLIVLVLWPSLLGLALYRAITYTYRITDRALLVDRGFLNPPQPPVWLDGVVGVSAGSNWLHRRLGIGWVCVTTADGLSLTLTALRDPDAFAALLRTRMNSA